MTPDLLLAIDQGSSSTRAIAFDLDLHPVATAVRPIATERPRPGWVEQDPNEILDSVVGVVAEVLAIVGAGRIVAAGLDNQGETVVAWDVETGRALAPAVSWQCNRSAGIVEELRSAGHEPEVRRRSGLRLDPYFSAGKMAWLLREVPDVRRSCEAGTLRFGTVDAWLTDRLAGAPLTDPSTASRTQLFDLDRLAWSPELLDLFGVPAATLGRVVDTAGAHGVLSHPTWGGAELPLAALACDQQAALAGHGAFDPGSTKATYGTGVFVMRTTGTARPDAGEALLATVAWRLPGEAATYAIDGGVFSAGTLLEWLRNAGILADVAASDAVARSVSDDAGVRLLPALNGLGAPWWRDDARGVIVGLRLGTRSAHVVRAALDAIAHRVADVVEAMVEVSGDPPDALRVDGGLTANSYLVERQADLLGVPVEVASASETTALGVAGLAGIGAGRIGPEVMAAANPVSRRVEPRLGSADRERQRAAWRSFVTGALSLNTEGGERRQADQAGTT